MEFAGGGRDVVVRIHENLLDSPVTREAMCIAYLSNNNLVRCLILNGL